MQEKCEIHGYSTWYWFQKMFYVWRQWRQFLKQLLNTNITGSIEASSGGPLSCSSDTQPAGVTFLTMKCFEAVVSKWFTALWSFTIINCRWWDLQSLQFHAEQHFSEIVPQFLDAVCSRLVKLCLSLHLRGLSERLLLYPFMSLTCCQLT